MRRVSHKSPHNTISDTRISYIFMRQNSPTQRPDRRPAVGVSDFLISDTGTRAEIARGTEKAQPCETARVHRSGNYAYLSRDDFESLRQVRINLAYPDPQ